jgi:hypothetical protein
MFIQKKSDLSAKALSELGMNGCTDGWLYGLKDGLFEDLVSSCVLLLWHHHACSVESEAY